MGQVGTDGVGQRQAAGREDGRVVPVAILTVADDVLLIDASPARVHAAGHIPGAVFMDCMPLIRGDEATPEVVDGPQSIRYSEAENRLHIQKAIMAALMGNVPLT